MVMVQYHLSDAYSYAWGSTRADFYGVWGIPWSWFDGVDDQIGAQSYGTYEGVYRTRLSTPTDVTIALSAEPVSGQTYHVSAEVCLESGGTDKTVRVHMVQVLDYWPSYGGYHRNGFKLHAQSEDITLAPGECQTIERDFTFDAESWANQEDITLVAWAQVPNDLGPAEVHQAAKLDWPFEPDCPADLDGDGTIGLGDLAILLGNYERPGGPDEGDLTGDGFVGLADLAIMLSVYGTDC
jgi:hypothetical protein